VFYHYTFRGYRVDRLSSMPYPALAPVAMYGRLGVKIFFMISGFVILITAASGSMERFFISRIVRLHPCFWVYCTLTFLGTLLAGGYHHPAPFRVYLLNMTMLSGFFGVPSIDGVYWSLFVELQFYFLVLLAGRSAGHRYFYAHGWRQPYYWICSRTKRCEVY
jgi:peptidoglycan/LPS O-acetylase OafA/YrhL